MPRAIRYTLHGIYPAFPTNAVTVDGYCTARVPCTCNPDKLIGLPPGPLLVAAHPEGPPVLVQGTLYQRNPGPDVVVEVHNPINSPIRLVPRQPLAMIALIQSQEER